MSMSFLAMLLSLAMLLTGAGVDGQPAEAAKTLVVHDLSVTYNGETVDLAPSLRLGAATDGEKAVFDLGVDLNGETLFPIQLGVGETGVTALFEKSDVAVNVSAEALNALSEQASQMLASAASEDAESAELMSFITGEFIPAYAGLFEAIQDEAFVAEMQAKSEEIFAGIVDRGEGTPVTELIEGDEYALTEYSYTVDGAQMAALADAIYTSDERLSNFYETLFKLYDMLPEESGLNGMHSFADMFEKMNLNMTLEADEKLSDDGEIDIMDGMLTMNLQDMVETMIEIEQAAETLPDDAIGGADEATDVEVEIPELAPIVMDISSSKVGDVQDATVSLDYEIDDAAVAMTVNAHSVGMTDVDMDMQMTVAEDGEVEGALNVAISVSTDEATGDANYAVSYDFSVEDINMNYAASGVKAAGGTAQNSFDINVNGEDVNVSVSFYADVVADAIEDNANGHEAAVVIDDFSDEAMSALGEDEAFQAAMMQVIGSVSADAQKLMADESVQQLMGLFTSVMGGGSEYDYSDASFEGEDYEYGEMEDDGELNYSVPEFTYLPEGWEVKETDIDTAYDWVSMTIEDESGDNTVYVTFYENYGDEAINYVVGGDGEIEAVDGREIAITDYGDGNLSVTLQEAGLYGSLSFYAEDIDVETIGQIVAGIQF